MQYTPILISAYSRPSHLEDCLKSLELCKMAINTKVYISIDAPAKPSFKKINRDVHKVAEQEWKFKSLEIISPLNNTNGKIIKDTAKILLQKYGRLIMSEEDNIFAYDFLSYMNWALDKYEFDKKVMSISAWSPYDASSNDHSSVFLYPGYCAWGVGLWHSKSHDLIVSRERQFNYLVKNLSSLRISFKYFSKANHLKRAIYNYFLRNGEAGDRYIDFKIFIENGFSVFPSISRVRNTGHDGSGINSKNDRSFAFQIIATGSHDFFLEKSEYKTQSFHKNIYKYYRLSKIKNIVLYTLSPFFYLYMNLLRVRNCLEKYFLRK